MARQRSQRSPQSSQQSPYDRARDLGRGGGSTKNSRNGVFQKESCRLLPRSYLFRSRSPGITGSPGRVGTWGDKGGCRLTGQSVNWSTLKTRGGEGGLAYSGYAQLYPSCGRTRSKKINSSGTTGRSCAEASTLAARAAPTACQHELADPNLLKNRCGRQAGSRG